ncbi:phenylalanine--tRNA ligase, mitochondrial isoform X3 [Phycodurus eques]|uniref:phenylalanine--tRNA ligase, mitochondrial isoform X3 n=1 Tax=Phycodurus eques TaxID=693459 RepID=UPI002ACD75CB|nr:phenylalanine--tRNA ligase, mitochondrial isoform X3 [Phycodurus eques]
MNRLRLLRPPLPPLASQRRRARTDGPAVGRECVEVLGHTYPCDDFTNVTPKILAKVGRNLHNQRHHPLWLLKERIKAHFYSAYAARSGDPLFSAHDNLSPVVSVEQNFDRSAELPQLGSNSSSSSALRLTRFLRMLIDRQLADPARPPQQEARRQLLPEQLFSEVPNGEDLKMFEAAGRRTPHKQEVHSLEAVKLLEFNLKRTLGRLVRHLFGEDLEVRWVDCYFPFTHPSFEMEVRFHGDWMEVLGCGVMEQQLLNSAGAADKAGWAFGLGLERLAMVLYKIPDIRIFWSQDERFLKQFRVDDIHREVRLQALSKYPPLHNDISFWLPAAGEPAFHANDFYELVRAVAGDLVEEVTLLDDFTHPTSGRRSLCFRVAYRHTERTLSQQEVHAVHGEIQRRAETQLGVEGRY